MTSNAEDRIASWPQESRQAAQLVIDTYGEPHEATATALTWFKVGQWKRVVASRDFHNHEFPAPHIDSVTSVIDYAVPAHRFSDLARFDGSVVADRTQGELSARCHDEQANFLALNLAHDIITDERDVDLARRYYAKEFLDARRGAATPYMQQLRFSPACGSAADTDERLLSDADLQAAARQGENKQR